MKKKINRVHLYLGLLIGLVMLIVALTGCIYAFQEEIQDLTQSYRFVEEQNEIPFLRPSQLKEIAQHRLPGKVLHSLKYGKKKSAAVLTFYNSKPEYYYLVYLDPYKGDVLKVKDMRSDFFRFILDGHFYLWLPPTIGKPVVAISTLIFVLMIISGIILWWPKNKAAARQRFAVKWNAKWRRKNYDLHNVMGFYACWVLIFIAFTGLVWGFQWFARSMYWVTSGGKTQIEYSEATSDTTKVNLKKFISPVDYIWKKTAMANPAVESIEIDFPDNNKSSIGITTNTDASTYWKADHHFYDQYTLAETPAKHAYGRFDNNLSIADKIVRMNYDIHVGGILGLTGKCLAFFASLICASLPVTGFMIWWGRHYKEKTKVVAAPAFIKYKELEELAIATAQQVERPVRKIIRKKKTFRDRNKK